MARTGLVDGTYAQRWLAERCRSESVPFILFPDEHDPNNGTLRFCPIHCGSEMMRMFAFILLDAHKELRPGSVRGVRKRGERMLYGEQGTAE